MDCILLSLEMFFLIVWIYELYVILFILIMVIWILFVGGGEVEGDSKEVLKFMLLIVFFSIFGLVIDESYVIVVFSFLSDILIVCILGCFDIFCLMVLT